MPRAAAKVHGSMDFRLPGLPYAEDALAPVLSAAAVRHHRQIHAAVLAELEQELAGSAEAGQSLEQIVLGSSGRHFNLAAQAYDHVLYWQSLRPGGGGAPPPGAVAERVARDFGGWEPLRGALIQAGRERFASGYLWLVADGDRLDVLATPNAETPLALALTPLWVVDLWEHAYYLDYQEQRDRYLEQVCDRLLNWDLVGERLVCGPA
jgi:superoxide dismutase, Fe-Mn family